MDDSNESPERKRRKLAEASSLHSLDPNWTRQWVAFHDQVKDRAATGCTFCLQQPKQVAKMWEGGGARICSDCVMACIKSLLNPAE